MTYIAILVLGVVSALRIPVSLMPDIDIPKISVQVSYANSSARELENTVVKPLRQQLMQIAHLEEIKSESSDGSAMIQINFKHGANIDYAFIEVNEKVDRAMNSFPRDIERPRVIKASATDIPVFYLNVSLKADSSDSFTGDDLYPVSHKFTELSKFSGQVIKRRLEQLASVAMVDISGQVYSEILILPDNKKLSALNMKLSQLETAIKQNNINLGNLVIHNGQYQYNIRFSSTLINKRDIENVYFKVENRLLQLKDVAQVIEHPQKPNGLTSSDGKSSICMAVIKQSDVPMREFKGQVNKLVEMLRKDYKEVNFEISRNQTQLLDYSIDNLTQSLVWGAMLAFLIMFFFLKDFRSPLLIGLTIPTSLLISLLFFYLMGISLNIISLSGLILGIGMMIDNSIIVIDNISQNRERQPNIIEACSVGTNEVFRPMLSSVLTTCAVFIPLIFISGIAGDLFYDQAMAISIGLFVSLIVSVTLLPVYYKLVYRNSSSTKSNKFLSFINRLNYEALYERGFKAIMRHQLVAWILFFAMLGSCYFLYNAIEKEKLPAMTKTDMILKIDWNESLNLIENNKRTMHIVNKMRDWLEYSSCMVGEQQFLLDHNSNSSVSESMVYLKSGTNKELNQLQENLNSFLKLNYKKAIFDFQEAGNIFDMIFADNQAPLLLKLRDAKDLGVNRNNMLQSNITKIRNNLGEYTMDKFNWKEKIVLKIDPAKLVNYGLNFDLVFRKLKTVFNENKVLMIADNNNFVPVILGGKPKFIDEILNEVYINNNKGKPIRLFSLVSQEKDLSLKSIIAGSEGEYFPMKFDIEDSFFPELKRVVSKILKEDDVFEADFAGQIFKNKQLVKELAYILVISLLLLYFILSAQFESLTLPLIVLLEVPIDIFGAFVFLKLFGGTINLMSLIGIIVMCGIIINDSILKIDTINQLRAEGYSLIRAMAVAGQRRLKPILMTSITTILALMPFLFVSGMGADLQKPLALAVIGGMLIGTFVSLYFIPLCYYYLKK
jgi:multidrug efflux pump subunit AcrB